MILSMRLMASVCYLTPNFYWPCGKVWLCMLQPWVESLCNHLQYAVCTYVVEKRKVSYRVGLCDNGNSLITIMQLSITILIITIFDNDIHLQSIPKYYNIQLYKLKQFQLEM